MDRSIKQITTKMSKVSENIQNRIEDYYFRINSIQSENVEPVLISWDLFQKIQGKEAKEAKDNGTADEKEDDNIIDTKMVIKSDVCPTMETEEQECVSEESKVKKNASYLKK